jgi:polyvinyl alcohol dehydrogenase (cytochrome)
LRAAWSISTAGEVSATPAVVDGAIYFPDWAGFFTKADARTGKVIWSYPVSDYTGVAGDVSRSSPAVSRGVVYIGNQGGTQGGGGVLIAIDARTGHRLWTRALDSHPGAILTQSPVVYAGVVYQGLSSQEEGMAAIGGYQCCTFRGSVVAVDARTGRQIWKTYTVPDNGGAVGGYSGGAVWSGTPAVDPARHRVYVTTGNNYEVPDSAKACQVAGGTAAQCLDPGDHINSILALDIRTGAIVWATGTGRFDDWNASCIPGFPPGNCPQNPGPDWDFGDGVHLFTVHTGGGERHLVGAGQKSGEYWAVDADTGAVVWSAAIGPGGNNGGIQWGSATDGQRIYVAEANSAHQPYQLADGSTVTSGSFAALDPATGRILWQVADPSGGVDTAAVSTAGAVVYAGSLTGRMFALDALTGKILWSYQGQGACGAAAAVVNSTVYWGNGYPNRLKFPFVPTPSVLYAFRR